MDSQSNEFEKLRGQAAIAIWADLSRESQEILFEAAVSSDADARSRLAGFLHDHPKRFIQRRKIRRPTRDGATPAAPLSEQQPTPTAPRPRCKKSSRLIRWALDASA
jgi:hypothetical protein